MIDRPTMLPRDSPSVAVVHAPGEEHIVTLAADVLGVPCCFAQTFNVRAGVVGVVVADATADLGSRDPQRIVIINAHNILRGMPPDERLSSACDYEFLYDDSPYVRRDLARFMSFVLGQISHHATLMQKKRTAFISTTFPDVRPALPNLDILTVGSDAVELRVDLLEEPGPDGVNPVPSLSYVGEQVVRLRQRTELPLIFTTRCTKENGRFPMDDPQLFATYLSRAVQWGVEYIDVELWLPEAVRRTLYAHRGNSRIISAFHDFSGSFKWPSPAAAHIYRESSKYADMVKMITHISSVAENYELEYFRSQISANHPDGLPLSALNMGSLGQISRALNPVFSPVTHPLLPIVAAPGQLSAAEINELLSTMGQLPKRTIYAVGRARTVPQAPFFHKCFNELGLAHRLASVDRGSKDSAEAFCQHPDFGGAYLHPPISSRQPYIHELTDAARTIAAIDTIIVRGTTRLGDNSGWRGIRSTLTRDFAPSAYRGRAAIVVSSAADEAATAIYALRSLEVGKVYTVGFQCHGALAAHVEPFTSIDSIQRVDPPFVIVSALSSDRSHLVQPLLRHFQAGGKVFVDLANGPRKSDPVAMAEASGWTAYGTADVSAFTTVQTLRVLVGQNVPYSFVRLASGRVLY